MCEELKTVEHVTVVDDIPAEEVHEEIMELLSAAVKNSRYRNWPEFYNEQKTKDLFRYLLILIIVNGKYRLLTSKANHRNLRYLPSDLHKLGFQIPKDFTKIENVIKTVIRSIQIRYSGSTKRHEYSLVEVNFHFDLIQSPNKPFYIKIIDRFNGKDDTHDFDNETLNNVENLRAILLAYSHSLNDNSDYINFIIEDATSQARALANWYR